MLYSIDIETYDPDLKKRGAGVRRGDGHIAGIAICTEISLPTYYSLAHPESENISHDRMAEILRRCAREATGIVGANLIYDLDWIEEVFGVTFYHVPWYDVQVAEPLIDEETTYSLDDLGERYLGIGKDEDIYRYCAAQFGGKPTRTAQAKNIWRCPASVVGPYAEQDARLALAVWGKQAKVLQREGLERIFSLEQRLQPILLKMKRRGVRIDEEKLRVLKQKFSRDRDRLLEELNVNVWSAASLAEMFDAAGMEYPTTEKGNPSFTASFLEACPWDQAQKVVRARKLDKLVGTFLESALERNLIRGRIHCQFNQLRGDEFGAVTGRLSSSLPNLQQVPSRSEIGRQIRTLFIPEDGFEWHKLDYSQIEPRLLLTYAAKLRGAWEMIEAYHQNPDLDCYEGMMETMPDWLERPAVKAIYLGSIYGMGIDKLADQMEVSREEAEKAYWAFHDAAPYIRKISKMVMNLAERTGKVRTIGGRYRRFRNKRYCYKALNAVIQGGAADIMKTALVEGVERGLEIPQLTVHDELDSGEWDREQAAAWSVVMTDVFSDELRVMMRVEPERGSSWGEVA